MVFSGLMVWLLCCWACIKCIVRTVNLTNIKLCCRLCKHSKMNLSIVYDLFNFFPFCVLSYLNVIVISIHTNSRSPFLVLTHVYTFVIIRLYHILLINFWPKHSMGLDLEQMMAEYYLFHGYVALSLEWLASISLLKHWNWVIVILATELSPCWSCWDAKWVGTVCTHNPHCGHYRKTGTSEVQLAPRNATFSVFNER